MIGTGITVDGIPLPDHLEELETTEATEEIQKELAKEKAEKKRIKRRRVVRTPMSTAGPGTRRARRLTDDEIRREKGIMSKPFKTVLENILWLMKESGTPVSVATLAAELEALPKDISSRMNQIYKRLEPKELMTRDRVGMAFMYRLTSEGLSKSVPQLYKAYSKYKKRKTRPDPKPDAPTGRETGLESMFPTGTEAFGKMFLEAVTDALSKRGLAIQVTGEIKILFGWAK